MQNITRILQKPAHNQDASAHVHVDDRHSPTSMHSAELSWTQNWMNFISKFFAADAIWPNHVSVRSDEVTITLHTPLQLTFSLFASLLKSTSCLRRLFSSAVKLQTLNGSYRPFCFFGHCTAHLHLRLNTAHINRQLLTSCLPACQWNPIRRNMNPPKLGQTSWGVKWHRNRKLFRFHRQRFRAKTTTESTENESL